MEKIFMLPQYIIRLGPDEIIDFMVYVAVRSGVEDEAQTRTFLSGLDEFDLYELYAQEIDLDHQLIEVINAEPEDEDVPIVFESLICPLCGTTRLFVEDMKTHLAAEHEDFFVYNPVYEPEELIVCVEAYTNEPSLRQQRAGRTAPAQTSLALVNNKMEANKPAPTPVCPKARLS